MSDMTYLFPIPPKVEKRLNMLRSNFLWQRNKEKEGVHLVKWKTLTPRKQQRGLRIQILGSKSSLLMKWLWRYSNESSIIMEEVD